MISEKVFISSFNSFWQDLIPTGEAFVRAINLGTHHFDVPLRSSVESNRRGMVNEFGFRLLEVSITSNTSIEDAYRSKELLGKIAQHAINLASRYQNPTDEKIAPLGQDELVEGLGIAKRLRMFFQGNEPDIPLTPSPRFLGCGFIDDCIGDLLVESTLYEVKSGDRTFRLLDVRQILVYLALNYVSHTYRIGNIGFVNPRTGSFYKLGVSDFALAASGKNAIELLSELVEFASSGDVSR
jgi:hypothetical protein